jgi:hypothetical protein
MTINVSDDMTINVSNNSYENKCEPKVNQRNEKIINKIGKAQ